MAGRGTDVQVCIEAEIEDVGQKIECPEHMRSDVTFQPVAPGGLEQQANRIIRRNAPELGIAMDEASVEVKMLQAAAEVTRASLEAAARGARQRIVDHCFLQIAGLPPEFQRQVLDSWMDLDKDSFPLAEGFNERVKGLA